MRSGRAYLAKRRPSRRIETFESRDLRHAFPPAPVIELASGPEPQIESELDKNQWSVVSFSGVEAGGLTYDQAVRLIEVLGENDIHGLCIITDVAALQID